jgi:hypothetical protein
MFRKLFTVAMFSSVAFTVFAGTPAEAGRRFFWWQNAPTDSQQVYDPYGDNTVYGGQQDYDVQDQFNQRQYDLYMREMRHQKRKRNVNGYYEAIVAAPNYGQMRRHKQIKKTVQTSAVLKQTTVKPAPAPVQAASIGKRYESGAVAKSVDCNKGATIVAGYGFSSVTSKNCSGNTLVYSATRSGSNFEIQVSASSGELTAVKKL